MTEKNGLDLLTSQYISSYYVYEIHTAYKL